MLESLNQYMIRIGLFIFLILVIVVFLYPILQIAFLSNIFINSTILLALIFGLVFNVYHLMNLNNDYDSLKNFNIHKTPQVFLNGSNLLKSFYSQMHKVDGRYSFKSSIVEKILERVDISLINLRETSRYLVGLLVFLGLLGTFWGLLKTIGSVGNVISGLGIDETNVAGFFNSLKDGLNAPLEGMSVAFSSSLLGLAGSLILGFADLNLGQAQNKFTHYLEKTLQNNTTPDFTKSNNIDNQTTIAIQKLYDNLDSLVFALKETTQNQNQIFTYMQSLTKQIKELNNNSRESEKKISNFLSTQLNTQANISQLTSQLTNEGLIDKKTKKYFENIDKGIQQLIKKK